MRAAPSCSSQPTRVAPRRGADCDKDHVLLSVTAAGQHVLQDKRNARTRQLAKALSAGFTPAERAGGVLSSLPPAHRQVLTGREFFPDLISAPFHHGLMVVFAVAAGLAVLAAFASQLRGGRHVHPGIAAGAQKPRSATPAKRGTPT